MLFRSCQLLSLSEWHSQLSQAGLDVVTHHQYMGLAMSRIVEMFLPYRLGLRFTEADSPQWMEVSARYLDLAARQYADWFWEVFRDEVQGRVDGPCKAVIIMARRK